MQLVLLTLLVVVLVLQLIVVILLRNAQLDMAHLQGEISQLRRAFTLPPTIGGRPTPSSADIAAARARADSYAPNQVAADGTAHPGGPRPI